MLKRAITLLAVYSIIMISMKGCIYTAMACFLILSVVWSPVYCIGEVEGEDFNHAWIRVNGYNIEQSKLNLYHSNKIDYDNPYIMLNTTAEFIDLVIPDR